MSVTIATPELANNDMDARLRKSVAFITWFVIIFVPAYSVVHTKLIKHPYTETDEKTFLWPWMILTKYSPIEYGGSEQYAVVTFPWSFILFIPFFYAFKSAWMLYQSNENRIVNSAQIVLASIVQYFLIFMVFKSQDDDIAQENLTIYFIPQILLIIIHSVLTLNWYITEFNEKTQANKK